MIQAFAQQQFGGIWGDGAGEDDIQPVILLAHTDDVVRIVRAAGKVMGQSHSTGRVGENAAQRAFADVDVYQYDFLFRLGDAHGEVARNEGLARTGIGRGKHDDLKVGSLHAHEVHVGTDDAESL